MFGKKKPVAKTTTRKARVRKAQGHHAPAKNQKARLALRAAKAPITIASVPFRAISTVSMLGLSFFLSDIFKDQKKYKRFKESGLHPKRGLFD